MPLTLTPATRAAAGTLTGLRALASAYESATRQLDAMLDAILGLADADLAELANAMGAEQMTQLLSAHAAQVAAVNSLTTGAQTTIAALEDREPTTPRQASTATLDERLAAQHRAIELTDSGWIVKPLPKPEQPPADHS